MGDSRTEYFIYYWRPSEKMVKSRNLSGSLRHHMYTPINTIKRQLIIVIIKCYGAASIKTLFMGQHLINPFFLLGIAIRQPAGQCYLGNNVNSTAYV